MMKVGVEGQDRSEWATYGVVETQEVGVGNRPGPIEPQVSQSGRKGGRSAAQLPWGPSRK